MDEKTEELRELFVGVTDAETVTERQVETHGSLADRDEAAVDERLEEVIGEMRERYEFESDLPASALCRVVRGFYAGESDADLAAALEIDLDTVVRARLDLHLVREADADAPFDLAALRELADVPASEAAAALDADAEAVRRYRRVLDTRDAIRAVSQRYISEFEAVLTDAALSTHLTESVRDDGLREATEDIETDVSF